MLPENLPPFLHAALSYAQRGWPVFPCARRGKEPIIQGGFYNAYTDTDKIHRTWSHPIDPPNIGIRTGEMSKTLVIDVDIKNNFEGEVAFAEWLKEHGLDWDLLVESTYVVSTGSGGWHFYFQHPGGYIGNRTRIMPGVDVRCDGGYVIAAPSQHECGGSYAVFQDKPLAPLPPALLEFLTRHAEAPKLSTGDTEGLVVEGQRNDYLMRIAGALRRPGLHADALAEALLVQNDRVCNPPLPEAEVLRIAQNISRYEPSQPVNPEDVSDTDKKPLPYIRGSDLAKELFDYLGDKDKVHGKPTGLASFDKLLGGGKRLGEVTAWHAEAKTGKNSLWHKFMHIWLEQGTSVGYASREINPSQDVLPNLLSVHTQTNVWKTPLTDEKKKEYADALNKWPIFFSTGYGVMTITEVKEWLVALHTQGVEYFWFDHLHFMLEDPEDHKAAAKLIKEMKILAQQLRIHIDIIIQPNRLEEGKKLSMHSLKGGAVINQTVDNLIILERLEDQENVLEVKLELGRSKLVKRGKLWLQYNEETTDYVEVEKEKPEPKPVYATQKPNYFPPSRPSAPKNYTNFNNKYIGDRE